MRPSVYCTIGPFFPTAFSEGTADLTQHNGRTARGQHIVLAGRVLELDGAPTMNSILEIWQADSAGVFRHSLDPRCPEADPGFFGWGRARTDKDGWYRFRTVLPGGYENRVPHVNLMVLAIGLTRRLVTTAFFADRPEAASDPVLDCVPDPAARLRLFARRDESLDSDGAHGYRFDLILRGEGETPFFRD